MSVRLQKALNVVNSDEGARRRLAEKIGVLSISPLLGDVFYMEFPSAVPNESYLERIKELALMYTPSKVVVRQYGRYGKQMVEEIGPQTTLTVNYGEHFTSGHDVPKADEPEHYKFVVFELNEGRYGLIEIYVPINTRQNKKMAEKPRWNIFGRPFGRTSQLVEEALTDYSKVFVMSNKEDIIAINAVHATHPRIDAMETALEERLFGMRPLDTAQKITN